METTTASFDILPQELIVLICAQLPVADLLSLRCSKTLYRICNSDDVWRNLKKDMLTDKWSFTAKVDSLPISIVEKIRKKIELQKNWRNSELIPNAFSLPLFDGQVFHAYTKGNRLLLIMMKCNGAANLIVYDLEGLKLINTIEYPEEFDYSVFPTWDGGDYVVLGQDQQIERGFGEDGTIGANMYHFWVWDLASNSIWSLDACVNGTEYLSIYGNHFFYLPFGGGVHVVDLSTRQHVIKEMFIDYGAAHMHIESRGVILFKQHYDANNDKLKFVQFSEDWQSIVFEKELDFEVHYVHQLRATKDHIVVALFNEEDRDVVLILDRKTFNVVFKYFSKTFFALKDDVISIDGPFNTTIFNLTNNTTSKLSNRDLFHIQSDLFLAGFESGIDRTQCYSIVSLPELKQVQELSAPNENALHERFTSQFKKFDWFSNHYKLELVLVNQSQMIVIYQNQGLSKACVFIIDFCDVVFPK